MNPAPRVAKSLGAGVIVDLGFSNSHIVPFFDGMALNYATKRIDIGGKALTNYLKELVSYRSLPPLLLTPGSGI